MEQVILADCFGQRIIEKFCQGDM